MCNNICYNFNPKCIFFSLSNLGLTRLLRGGEFVVERIQRCSLEGSPFLAGLVICFRQRQRQPNA